MSDEPINVENVEQVNVTQPEPLPQVIPYVWVLAAVTFAVLLGFAAVTYLVLQDEAGKGIDAATKGALIQTWNNLATLGAGFWLGSSLAGKMQSGKK